MARERGLLRGDWIREIREDHGLPPEQVARDLAISVRTLRRWVNGGLTIEFNLASPSDPWAENLRNLAAWASSVLDREVLPYEWVVLEGVVSSDAEGSRPDSRDADPPTEAPQTARRIVVLALLLITGAVVPFLVPGEACSWSGPNDGAADCSDFVLSPRAKPKYTGHTTAHALECVHDWAEVPKTMRDPTATVHGCRAHSVHASAGPRPFETLNPGETLLLVSAEAHDWTASPLRSIQRLLDGRILYVEVEPTAAGCFQEEIRPGGLDFSQNVLTLDDGRVLVRVDCAVRTVGGGKCTDYWKQFLAREAAKEGGDATIDKSHTGLRGIEKAAEPNPRPAFVSRFIESGFFCSESRIAGNTRHEIMFGGLAIRRTADPTSCFAFHRAGHAVQNKTESVWKLEIAIQDDDFSDNLGTAEIVYCKLCGRENPTLE